MNRDASDPQPELPLRNGLTSPLSAADRQRRHRQRVKLRLDQAAGARPLQELVLAYHRELHRAYPDLADWDNGETPESTADYILGEAKEAMMDLLLGARTPIGEDEALEGARRQMMDAIEALAPPRTMPARKRRLRNG
jgi:hypothetical protein